MKRRTAASLIGATLVLTSCAPTVDVNLKTPEPIHITMDVNIRVDKELDDFFSFEDTIDGKKDAKTGEGSP